MIRLLHLCSADADFQTQRAVAQLSTQLRDGFETEVRYVDLLNIHGLFNTVRALRDRAGKRFDVIHAHGRAALIAAATGAVAQILYSPLPDASSHELRWTRAVASSRNVHIVCPTATLRRRHVEAGVPLDRTHLIRPGVEFSRIKKRDPAFRALLGFGESDYVILSPNESTPAAANRVALWSAAILNVLDSRHKVLLWGRGPMAKSDARFAGRLHQAELVTVAESKLGRKVEYEELLSAADMALVTATGAIATLPICTCMAAGVPIVSSVTYSLGEILEDRHSALMVSNRSAKLLAQRILDLRADDQLRWSITDTARTEAYEYFSATRFLQQYRAIYRQMASEENIQVPEESASIAARFRANV